MQEKKCLPVKVSTIVCNHSSGIDVPTLFVAFKGDLSFLANNFIEKIPIASTITICTEGLFVTMGGSEEAK